jgi:outer membrane lipoprotein-sorting protein
MNGFLLAVALVAFASSGGLSASDVLARMLRAQQQLDSLSARLVQQKSFPQLGIEDPEETGRFLLLRDEQGSPRIRVEIEQPERRVLVVNGGEYVLYQPRIKQAIEGTVGAAAQHGATGVASLLTGSASLTELEKRYELERLPNVRLRGAEVELHHVRLRARPEAGSQCRQIELFIDSETNLPVRQVCEEVNGSILTVSLLEPQPNVEVHEDEFELELPKDVERIRG